MTHVKIADVSHWEKGLLVKNLHKNGYEALLAKASQRNIDVEFENFYDQALEEMMFFGAYHYLDMDYNIGTQAELFLTVTEGKQIHFPLIADLEMAGTNAAAKSKLFIDLLVQAGRKVMIYTSPGYWKYTLGSPAWGALYPLWIAHYTWPIPTVPAPWKKWHVWQKRSTATIPEQKTIGFDDNEFNGDLGELLVFLEASKPQKSIEEILAEHTIRLNGLDVRVCELEKILQGAYANESS